MSANPDAREFLTSRRSRLSPERAGLPAASRHRRVPGLRREEVALLAGVSVEYYTKLERGNLRGASSSVLSGIANALQLTDYERNYFFSLASAANLAGARPVATEPIEAKLRPALQRLIDAMPNQAVYIRNGRLDVLGANAEALAVFPWLTLPDDSLANIARYAFLDPAAKQFFPDWEAAVSDSVSLLRLHSATYPGDQALKELVAELGAASPEFRRLWAGYTMGRRQVGQKHFNHPTRGRLDFDYEILSIAGDPDLVMIVYSEPVE